MQKHADQESRQYEMPDSPTTAMNVERPLGDTEDYSRRSSLRSTSIYDSRPGSPGGGPEKTDPWDAASRRSSRGPELTVTTTADEPQQPQEAPPPQKMSLLNLLPVRLLAEMHPGGPFFNIFDLVCCRPRHQRDLLVKCTQWFHKNLRIFQTP